MPTFEAQDGLASIDRPWSIPTGLTSEDFERALAQYCSNPRLGNETPRAGHTERLPSGKKVPLGDLCEAISDGRVTPENFPFSLRDAFEYHGMPVTEQRFRGEPTTIGFTGDVSLRPEGWEDTSIDEIHDRAANDPTWIDTLTARLNTSGPADPFDATMRQLRDTGISGWNSERLEDVIQELGRHGMKFRTREFSSRIDIDLNTSRREQLTAFIARQMAPRTGETQGSSSTHPSAGSDGLSRGSTQRAARR